MPEEMKVRDIKIDSIIFKEKARQRKDYGDLTSLMLSIERKGLLHPIIVEPFTDDDVASSTYGETFYMLRAGGRRLSAYKAIGRETIPCALVGTLTEVEAEELELEENILRKNLTYQEYIYAVERIHNLKRTKYCNPALARVSRGTWTQKDTAKELNISESQVSQSLALAEAMREFPQIGEAGTRQEALRIYRQIESGCFEKAASTLTQQMKETFHYYPRYHDGFQVYDVESIDLMFLDLRDLPIEDVIGYVPKLMKTTGDILIFFELERLMKLKQICKDHKLNTEVTPRILYFKGKDDFIPFVWASTGKEEVPPALQVHYSYNPHRKALHHYAKSAPFYNAIITELTAKGALIAEPFSYSMACCKVCMDQNRVCRAVCGNKTIYDKELGDM